MKITICAYDAPNNIDGPTSWMKRLLPFLRENGVEIRIIFFAAHTKDLPAYNYFTMLGFQCKLIYWELFNEQKVIEILKDIREFPPDIFIPNFFAPACYAARWVKQSGIPTICILHNDDDFHLDLLKIFASGENENKVSAIVGVSKIITKTILEQNPKNVIVECLPYGAPVPKKVANISESETLKLVYVGRMNEEQKRISEVAKALCRAASEISGIECIMYGAGKDLQNALHILETEGKELPVYYGGNLETTEVQEYLSKNHVIVLLSDYEGLPIALMEAMACGLVPVCTNIRSGMTELIKDENGFLINDRSDSFINAIKKLKSSPELWKQMSKAARRKIVTEYSSDVWNVQWLKFFKTIFNEKKDVKALELPTINEVRNCYKTISDRCSNPAPHSSVIPLYKLKTFLGRITKELVKQASIF